MLGSTRPYPSLSSLRGALKAAYSNAIDALYAYLVRGKGNSKGLLPPPFATLRFRDPNTFQETHHIVVKDGGEDIDNLNELEFVKVEIYANIWHADRIARISPQDGHVIAWIDLTGLLPSDQKVDAEAVLNGIAYDSQHDRLFVTGKEWHNFRN